MRYPLFRKAFLDRKRSLSWWTLGMAMLGGMYTALYPSLEELFDALEEYPEEILQAFGLEGVAQLATPEGYLQVELFSFMAPIAIIVFATIIGVNAIAGSERKGEMELLMANPISRTTVFAQRFAAMLALTLWLPFVLWVTIAIGIPLGVWPDMSNWNLVQALLSAALLGWAFGSLGMCLSAATGSTGISYSVVGAVALGTFMINSFSQIIDGMEPFKWVSPFHYYLGSNPLTEGLTWWHPFVPVAATLAAYAAGHLMFNRRDLKLAG